MPDLIEIRRKYCESRLTSLRRNVGLVNSLGGLRQLCVYVTGSYGRLEASEHSDLDLFFIHTGSARSRRVSRIQETLVRADLIRVCREMEFPEFSGDAEYLEIHYLDTILNELGSRSDDYRNFFTARLLLLLESRPIFNNQAYRFAAKRIIGSYYRDFSDHPSDFRPIFLANDIIRFWKTLCLNYEHRRNRPSNNENERNKNHLKNLKLKFSRMMTCFSTIMYISDHRHEVIDPNALVHLVDKSPLERLQDVARRSQEGEALLANIESDYEWFLSVTGRPQNTVLEWISDRHERDLAFDRAREFGKHMFELLSRTTEGSDTLRYLVI